MSKQVTPINDIFKWVDTYTATIAAIGIGLFFFFHHLEKPKVKTPYKVVDIEGQVADYSFQPQPGKKATLKQYYIWLDNYACTFQIKTDFLTYFYRSRFERDVKRGDSIRISIPKIYESKLQDKKSKIFTLSISKDSAEYLRLRETIPKENTYLDLFAGLFFWLAGGIYYFLKRDSIVP
ncbi:MAG TPA: hypothetical protein VGK10_11775 [Prolixibacteraceae bacterium]|jgi:hypothetical protein